MSVFRLSIELCLNHSRRDLVALPVMQECALRTVMFNFKSCALFGARSNDYGLPPSQSCKITDSSIIIASFSSLSFYFNKYVVDFQEYKVVARNRKQKPPPTFLLKGRVEKRPAIMKQDFKCGAPIMKSDESINTYQ